MGRKVVYWVRATCFGTPIGPWHMGHRGARADLRASGLGNYEGGIFYITVPGGLEVREEWMDYAEAQDLSGAVERRHAAQHREALSVTYLNGTMNRVR